jgi:hypothetical protein
MENGLHVKTTLEEKGTIFLETQICPGANPSEVCNVI